MLAKRVRRHLAGTVATGVDGFPLPSLPVEIQSLVLAAVEPDAIPALIQSSKSVAEQVLKLAAQKWPGRVGVRVQARHGKDWAATRRLLQWAPPACLKLTVSGPDPIPCTAKLQRLSCSATNELFHAGQPLLSLTEVHLQSLLVTWVIPTGLADTCPNVHTMHLDNCRIMLDDACSRRYKAVCASIAPAPSIRHLKVFHTEINGWSHLMESAEQGKPRASALVNLLKASLPNLCRLNVGNRFRNPLMRFLGSQLTELAIRHGSASVPAAALVCQLKKLVMPEFKVHCPWDFRNLLAMPQVSHLEINGFRYITEDFTSHSCTWRYLRLHMLGTMRLYLMDLANVPLHSLTSPLVLGDGYRILQVVLPNSIAMQSLAPVQHVTNQLLQHGVEVLADEVSYVPSPDLPTLHSIDQSAELLSVAGPLFHTLKRVSTSQYVAGDQVIRVLSDIRRCLASLRLQFCSSQLRTQQLWSTLLVRLPHLVELEVHGYIPHFFKNFRGTLMLEMLCLFLTTAMSQQPARRRVQVSFPDTYRCINLQGLINKIRSKQGPHAPVEFDARHDGAAGLAWLVVTAERSVIRVPPHIPLRGMFHACSRNVFDHISRLLF